MKSSTPQHRNTATPQHRNTAKLLHCLTFLLLCTMLTFTVSCTKENLTTATTENNTATTDAPITFRGDGDCNCYVQIISVTNAGATDIWNYGVEGQNPSLYGKGNTWWDGSTYQSFPSSLIPIPEGTFTFKISWPNSSPPSSNFTVEVRFVCYEVINGVESSTPSASATYNFIWENGYPAGLEGDYNHLWGQFGLNCDIIELPGIRMDDDPS